MARYYGGKNHLYQQLINLIPRHERYVEAFAGSAAVARHLARSAEAIVIERDQQQAAVLRMQLPGHRVLNECGINWLRARAREFGPETVVYVDPPYPIEDRRDPRARYRCELTTADHETLLYTVRVELANARVLVSGQPWGLYARELQAWQRHEFPVILRSGKPGVECVWTNFRDPFPLHDYRYFGADKRRRQDLRRQVRRNLEKFREMDRHARVAVLRALVAEHGVL